MYGRASRHYIKVIMECVDIVYYNFVDLFQCLLVCSDRCLSSFSFPPSFAPLFLSSFPSLSLPVVFPSPLSSSPPLLFPFLYFSLLFLYFYIHRFTLSFSQAIRLLESSRLKDSEEEELWTDALVKLYINLSLTNLKQKKPKCAITNCRRVLELKENNVKATFTLAKV